MDDSIIHGINGSDDEDTALRRAIELSMGNASSNYVDLTSEPDGEDGASDADDILELKTSPVAKQKQQGREDGPESTSQQTPQTVVLVSSAQEQAIPKFDRKALEAERLARRQKQLDLEKQQAQSQDEDLKDDSGQSLNELLRNSSKRVYERQEQQGQAWKRKKENFAVIKSDSEGRVAEADRNTSAPSEASPPARRRKLYVEDEVQRALPLTQGSRPSADIGGNKNKDAAKHDLATEDPSLVSSAGPKPPPLSDLPFAKGVTKKTWVRGQPRTGDDITIEEIWKKDEVELAVLSSFQWDEDWIMERFNLRKTKMLLIAYAADDNQKQQMRENVAEEPNIRFCFPPMPMPGYMHSKLQILSFSKYLRIVVATGNLVPYDWGETGGIENMVFLLDLPLLPYEYHSERNRTLTPFFDDLVYFLHAQGVQDSLVNSLRRYDFSETKRFAFVHSIPGSHVDESFYRTGYCGLGRAVRSLGLETRHLIQMDYLCSSLGSVNDDLLTALYYACQGDSGLKEFEARTKARGSAKGRTGSLMRKYVRLYFPSEQTVANSRGGKNHAGTICFRSKWWEAPTFPREVLRDVQSTRRGVLLHTKLLLVQPKLPSGKQGTEDDTMKKPIAWAYIGSSNVSESAWGRVVKDRTSGKPKMTCRNWECGVIIPTADSSMDVFEKPSKDGEFSDGTEDPSLLDVFRGIIPIPFSVPGAKYAGRKPWFFMDQ